MRKSGHSYFGEIGHYNFGATASMRIIILMLNLILQGILLD